MAENSTPPPTATSWLTDALKVREVVLCIAGVAATYFGMQPADPSKPVATPVRYVTSQELDTFKASVDTKLIKVVELMEQSIKEKTQ